MNNAIFVKALQNARKDRAIKLLTAGKRKNYFVSEPYYHTSKFFSENL